MKFRFLNKTIEHQRFQYKPMYYDERKERLERKKSEYDAKSKSEDERRAENLRDSMRESWSRAQATQSAKRSSNLRVLLLVGLIVALGYFLFNGVDEVDTIVTKLW